MSTQDAPSSGRPQSIVTPITQLLGIQYPVILAGMNLASGPRLAAAVSNAGGLGVVGGIGSTPKMLRKTLKLLKSELRDPNLPFGVDLLLPKVGKGARKTNYDYTKGQLPELIQVIIEEGAKLFVSAVGVPPKWAVDRLHRAGIPVMNMIGSPKHVKYCIRAGVDIVCAQGGEAGGHTGEVATSVLVPAVVDLCRRARSPLTGEPMLVVAAGGIYDGRGLAMALTLGADAAWVGTRFVASVEAGAPQRHKRMICESGHHDTVRTLVWTGRPLRCKKNNYIMTWETKRKSEMETLLSQGKVPYKQDGIPGSSRPAVDMKNDYPCFMGQVAGSIRQVKPARQIVEEMVSGAIQALKKRTNMVTDVRSKL